MKATFWRGVWWYLRYPGWPSDAVPQAVTAAEAVGILYPTSTAVRSSIVTTPEEPAPVKIHITASGLSGDRKNQLLARLRHVAEEFGASVHDTQPRRRYLKGGERIRVAADIKARYEAGATIRDIAEETGRPERTVGDLLDFIDPTARLRGRGGKEER